MRVLTSASQVPRRLRSPVVAIGAFDGVHRAHQAVLRRIVSTARRINGSSIVVTFDPHPQHVLRAGHLPRLITRLDQRIELFCALQIDYIWVMRFTKRFAAISPETFFKRTVAQRLRAHTVVVGRSFGFGHDRLGDNALLHELARPHDVRIRVVPDVRIGHSPVNSSRVRQAIAAGELRQARQLLGRPVITRGPVVRGAARGRRLGYPTANLDADHLIVPPHGVYVVRAHVGSRTYRGVANIGVRPTFEDVGATVEVHLLNYHGRLYGCTIDVEWLKLLRPERRFASVRKLQEQITSDITAAKHFFRRK